MRTANIHGAKTQLSRLVEAALAGEEVVIARNGVPVVKLVPVETKPAKRRGGFWKGRIVVHDPDWWHSDPDHPDPLFTVAKRSGD